MNSKTHWDKIYGTRRVSEVSWFQQHAELSLKLIQEAGLPPEAAIIDVGGGASTLVEDLLAIGFHDITVLDVSSLGLAAAKKRLGESASQITWLQADILEVELPESGFDVWHDRAVFHFLISAEDRRHYVESVLRAVKFGGLLIVATFAEDGPTMCSGLRVMRYSVDRLSSQFGKSFVLMKHQTETHKTPRGEEQPFLYCVYRKC